MNAEIITIGDELLIGQVTNTNQAFIGEQLTGIGMAISHMTTVGDDIQAILDAFDVAWERSDAVVVTGGLGPTHDDITKRALCEFFRTDAATDPSVRANIERLLKTRGIQWAAAHEEQALVPRKASVMPNPVGTAPGLRFEQDGKFMFVLPGVPYEMVEIVRQSLIPYLSTRIGGPVLRHLTLRTTGVPESLLAQYIGNLDEILEGSKLAFLPSPRGVRLRITAQDRDAHAADERLQIVERRIRSRVEKYIYGTGDEELEEVLGKMLTEKKLTLAVAESCTGGLIADRITNVSGSSMYFERGVVVYSNESKVQLLGVPPALIEARGAVSKEVAEAMAQGIRTLARTSIGLSTTGIAGPTGGSTEKPVGLVWIGYSDGTGTLALKFNFGDQRLRVKERASQAALEIVRRKVLGIG